MAAPCNTGAAGEVGDELVLADVGEDQLLAEIFPLLQGGPSVIVGPGDDTALVRAPGGAVLVTTDAMVRGRDWLEEWSGAADVGAKSVAQNVADIAAMGGVATGLLVTLIAAPETTLSWVRDFTQGLAQAATAAGVPVVGGDLSSAPAGTLAVSVTALGDLQGREPVLRSGARAGDVVAVAGTLGRSAAGLALLRRGEVDRDPALVADHRCPRPPWAQGPLAATAGATAMLDISDGLGRDAGRIARASGVRIELSEDRLRPDIDALVAAVGAQAARDCVLSGGEEHSLLACFPARVPLPTGWREVGVVSAGAGVAVDGQAVVGGGWDHFAG